MSGARSLLRAALGDLLAEHVGGVGQQRQRPGDQAGDDLHDHEAGDERERDGQRAAVGRRRDRVIVMMPATVVVPVLVLTAS